jgi:FdhD protein
MESGCQTTAQDFIAVEEPLQIRTAGRALAVTMRTPGHDFELAAGFLFTEGLIETPDQIRDIRQDGRGIVEITLAGEPDLERSSRSFYMSSSCGICGKTSVDALKLTCAPLARGSLRLSSADITALPGKLRQAQAGFEHTGALHAAALFDSRGELMSLREDVGRHNALDKLIGAEFLNGRVPLNEKMLMLSGRISFELVQKALRAGIAVVAAVGAPSSLAIETALRFQMTLVGFVRDGRFNVYAGSERLI